MEQIFLADILPKEILQKIQDAFAGFTGMASLISDANGIPLTEGSNFTHFCMDLTRQSVCGGKNCQECGRSGALTALKSGKPAVYRCHAGLMDYAAPIMLEGNFIGSFTGGQIRTSEVDEEFFRKKAVEYDIDPDEYVAAARATNVLDREEIEKAAVFLSEIAGVVSKLAYERFRLFEEKRQMERTAQTRANLLKKCSSNLNDDLRQLTDFLMHVAGDGVAKDDIRAREFSRQMAQNMLVHAADLDDSLNFMDEEFRDLRLHETVYDVRWIVQRHVEPFKQLAEVAGNTFHYEIASNVPRLLVGDPGRITDVVSQCVRNGMTHTKEGDVRLRVSARKEGYATTLVIRVWDNGEGMDPEFLKRMLHYVRSRGQSDYWDEELELAGMAIIGYSLYALNGTLNIESEPGQGTSFTIEIPQLAE